MLTLKHWPKFGPIRSTFGTQPKHSLNLAATMNINTFQNNAW